MRIKQLEWSDTCLGGSRQVSQGVSGTLYLVTTKADGGYNARRSENPWVDLPASSHATMEQAKAACQAHFESQVRRYLIED